MVADHSVRTRPALLDHPTICLRRRWNMKGWMVALAATLALALVPAKAQAGFCGIARYSCCDTCCQMETHTVMKTVHCIEYEPQCFTCYKTVWDRVCEDHIVNCVKYVPECRTREVCYTVCKQCFETKTYCYTVCKPCWETKTREVCYTVCKPCWEEKTGCYTVCKPCWETKTREICYSVMVPVNYTKTIQVPTGHWETEEYCVPGPTHTRCVRE